MNLCRACYIVIKKDLELELRTKEIVSSMFVFAFLVVVVFSFIFEPGEYEIRRIAGGTYWMALIFAGLLGLGRSMQREIEGGNLDAALLSPIPRNALFLGKALANFILLTAMQLVMIPLFAVLYEVNMLASSLMPVMALAATLGFVMTGTLLSLIAARSSSREILLPLLLLPLSVPLVLAAIQFTNGALQGHDLADYAKWLKLIAVYDVIFTTLSLVLFEPLVES